MGFRERQARFASWPGERINARKFRDMRVLPYFVAAVAVVAIGGAVAGGAIDTTPRQIFDSSPTLPGNSIAFERSDGREAATSNHYPLEAEGETYEVAELRDRGLYSQDRYARSYFSDTAGLASEEFDYAAAEAEQRRWEAEQRVAVTERRSGIRAGRPATKQPLELERPAKVAKAKSGSSIEFVSQPVVQDTSAMANRR